MVLLKQGQVISMLQLDKQGLANELLENIEEELKWVLENWKNEVIKYMGFNEFKRNANTDYELERESNMIVAYLKANTYVLADSYGTGSLMLSDNPGFRSYMQSIGKEGGWNPARRGKNIVGHPEGTYTDVLGNKRTTSGSMKGKNLEGVTLNTGYTIQPVAPSRATEIAMGWLYKTYLPKAYKNAIQKTDFSKYLKES